MLRTPKKLSLPSKAHQRIIRETFVRQDPRPEVSLQECEVTLAEKGSQDWTNGINVILKYEWLGNTGGPQYMVVMKCGDDIVGACTFGGPGSRESQRILGDEYYERTICLERGACVHWTPKNAPSYMISRAIKLMNKEYGYELFYAYADESAGEIGNIYQALSWIYLGKGINHKQNRWHFTDPNTKRRIGSRAFYNRPDIRKIPAGEKKSWALSNGWIFDNDTPSKHKFVGLAGSHTRKRNLRNLLADKYERRAYPKRGNNEESLDQRGTN